MKHSKLKNFRLPIFAILFLGLSVNLFGQQQVQLSQFFNNYLFYNPAFAGRNYQSDLNVVYRQQWTGLDGAPQSAALNFHTRLPKMKLGLGLSMVQDKIGAYNNFGVRVAVAGEKRMGLNTIRFAMAPSIYSSSFSSGFTALDDPSQDPILSGLGESATAFDLNVGFLFQSPDYFVGFSVVNLLGSRLESLFQENSRTIILVAGMDYQLPSNENWSLHPSLLVKTDLQSLSAYTADITVLSLYKNKVFGGLAYRTFDAFVGIAGYQWFSSLGRFKVTYSYDYTTSTINNVSNGTHEISVNYSHFIDRPTVIDRYKNVRFL